MLTLNRSGFMKLKLCLGLCVFLGSMTGLSQDALIDKIKLVADKNAEVVVMGVVYNSRTMSDLQLPPSVGKARMVMVPIASLRDVSRMLNQGLLAQHTVQAVFLVDDGKKLVTNGKTIKYVMKLGLKHQYKTFSDATDLQVKVTGTISSANGKLGLDLSEEQ